MSHGMEKLLTILLLCSLNGLTTTKDTKGRHFVVTVPPTYVLQEFTCLLYITSDTEGKVVIKKHVSNKVTLVGNYSISSDKLVRYSGISEAEKLKQVGSSQGFTVEKKMPNENRTPSFIASGVPMATALTNENPGLRLGGFSVSITGSTIHQSDMGRQTKALVVTADVDVAVYVAADSLNSPAMYTAIPTSLASTYYGILSYLPYRYNSYNYVLVTSLKDDTHVYVSNFESRTYNVTLSYMESYSFRTTSDSSGTIVTSDSPVNLVAGSTCSKIPTSIAACDTIYDSPIPIEVWGQHFIIPPLYPRAGYIIRILARTKTTGVSFQYQTSESKETKSKVFTGMQELQLGNSSAVIRANTTVTIVQYGLGQVFDSTDGDPFMSSVSPVTHFSNNYTFPSPMSNKGFTNRIAITIEEKYMNELKLDGHNVVSITSCITMTVPEPFDHYRILILELSVGYHHLKHPKKDAKYSVLLYGLKQDAGIGCSLGFASDINECALSPCQNDAICTDNISGYQCICMPGYTGVNCETDIKECESSPCQNKGSCMDNINGYTCTCEKGYTGGNCEIDIDECQSSPCLNYAICTDIVNGYTCYCRSGYSGAKCETDIDECTSNPCQNGANCEDRISGYVCKCETGYGGINCETDIDECSDGSNNCDVNAECTNIAGSFTCICNDGYSGNGILCSEINECDSYPCKNGGKCVENINGYTCRCVGGYDGINCEQDIDECLSSLCKNNANCSQGINSYTCSCTTGYTGVNCEIDIDECTSNPCQNGAVCEDRISGYVCSCETGYTGISCETDTDELLADKPSKYTVIVGAVLGFIVILLGVYAVYSLVDRFKRLPVKETSVKKEEDTTGEEDTSYVNEIYMNMVEIEGQHSPENRPAEMLNVETAEEDYSNIDECRRGESKVYETIY